MTQSWRALLAGRGVAVHAVLTGPTDTDMTQGFEIPKASPESVARAIFDGIENGEEDIFPDPMSQSIAAGWRGGVAKALEREQAPFRRCRVSGRYRRSRRPLLSTSTSGVRGALPRTPGPRSAARGRRVDTVTGSSAEEDRHGARPLRAEQDNGPEALGDLAVYAEWSHVDAHPRPLRPQGPPILVGGHGGRVPPGGDGRRQLVRPPGRPSRRAGGAGVDRRRWQGQGSFRRDRHPGGRPGPVFAGGLCQSGGRPSRRLAANGN